MKYSLNEICDNYSRLVDEVKTHALTSGRDPNSVKILLVAKHQPIDNINAAIRAGCRDFAENYPEQFSGTDQDIMHSDQLKWHMIGHLQSRKIGIIISHFYNIHSLDSMALAVKLNRKCAESSRILPVFVEVNMSNEQNKYGFTVHPEKNKAIFIEEIIKISALPNLELVGLMTMPPFADSPESNRSYFIKTRELLEEIKLKIPRSNLIELSMGTSQDYRVAIEEGATWIRIGTKVFGDRI